MFGYETDRLRIRPWTEDDREAFGAIWDDPEVSRYVHAEFDEFAARQARHLANDGVCMGAVVEKATGAVIGISGTQHLGTTGDLEIGWIFRRAVWGRGYATEAGAAAMRHVLETLGRTRVVAIIDPENEASKRVAERLGMVYEARRTGAELGHRLPDIVVDLFSKTR
jgi:RimJ/RimL family protein N-acetyltransferase